MVSQLSCEDTLDINTNPLAATSADPNAVLPYVFVQYSARKVTELGTRICDVSQYISNTFNSPNRGSTSIFLTGNTWGMMYNQVLGNLSLIIADAEEAGEVRNNVNAIATILSAHIFYELTSLWEDVPFSQALNGQEFPTPVFESQEQVLMGIVELLDKAITLIDNRPATSEFVLSSSSDLFYGGDMNKWKILANSLKLRTLMMLRSGGANVDSNINDVLKQPLMNSNSQAALIVYDGKAGAQNGMNTIVTAFFGEDNESQNVFGPGDPIDKLLKGTNDPRWDLWVARNNLGAPGNDIFPDASTSVISNNVIRPTLPDVLMTPAEIDFYKAQLAIEGFSNAGDAGTNFKNGVRNSLKWWGQDIPGAVKKITDIEINNYVNTLSSPKIEDIHNQQYLAAFMMPVMAWNHVRRNATPKLDPPPGSSITTILKRFNYPPDEVGTNPNTPGNKATDSPMWFEK